MKNSLRLLTALALSAPLLQTSAATGHSKPEAVDFTQCDGMRLPEVGRVRLGYPTCGPTGIAYITTMYNPASSTETQVVAVTPFAKVTVVGEQGIPGLHAAVAQSIAPDENGATYLVGAAPNPSVAEGKALAGSTQFLVRYDLDGNRVWVHPIPAAFRVFSISAWKEGDLLGVRMNEGDARLSLSILSVDGVVEQDLVMPHPLLSTTDVAGFMETRGMEGWQSMPAKEQLATVAGSTVRVQTSGGISFVILAQAKKLLLVDPNGGVTEQAITIPSGAYLGGAVPDQPQKVAITSFGPGDRDAAIVRFDRKQRLQTNDLSFSGLSLGSAVCSKDDTYYGIKIDSSGATLLTGKLHELNTN